MEGEIRGFADEHREGLDIAASLVATAVQTALILVVPLFFVWGSGRPSWLALGVFTGIGGLGMLGLGLLDTPRRLHALAVRVFEGSAAPGSTWGAVAVTWIAALPGAFAGGLVGGGLWWFAGAMAFVLIGTEPTLDVVTAFPIAPIAGLVRAGYLTSRAMGVTAGRTWLTGVDVVFAALGLVAGVVATAVLVPVYLIVAFAISAAVNGAI